jgi:hypothetical protein
MRSASTIAVTLMFAVFFAASARAEDTGFDRFDGAWAGKGSVKESASSRRLKVKCNLTGTHTPTHLTLSGACRTLAVFSRSISADITYDPATGAYSGTYTGASVGPARLVGKRQGNGVDFDVTWPKPIDGDDKATMQIRNAGKGKFAIRIFDAPAPGAAPEKMVSIKMAR